MATHYAEDFTAEVVALYKKQLAAIREVRLSTRTPGISHQHILSHATYSPWLDNAPFREAYERIRRNTLVDVYRCFELWQLIERGQHVPGDVLEVGVWRGGTGGLMAKAAQLFSPGSRVFLADTFQGVVKAGEKDTNYKGGEHADTSVAIVEDLMRSLGVDNVRLLIGIYPEAIDPGVIGGRRIKLCHIDVDTYDSAKAIFEDVWPRLSPGGVVVFDDYGFWGCEGVTTLGNTLAPADGRFFHNVNGHAIFMKIA